MFIRNDIYEHLILDPADRGKDTAVILDWNDPAFFKTILSRRIAQSTGLPEDFEALWALFFEPHIRGEDSFYYILSRTLMRPREILKFVRECVDTAINRNHDRVTESDILQAEHTYSEDAFVDLTLEIRDVKPEYEDIPYAFIGARYVMSAQEVSKRISGTGVAPKEIPTVIDLLLWFGFLGIYAADEERYSYEFQHNTKRMTAGVGGFAYCIHPAYRRSLTIAMEV